MESNDKLIELFKHDLINLLNKYDASIDVITTINGLYDYATSIIEINVCGLTEEIVESHDEIKINSELLRIKNEC